MNAKGTPKVLVVLSVLLGLACSTLTITAACAAEPAATNSFSSARSVEQRLSRNDVDTLLRQARTAIQQGNLDQADALLIRAENSGIHYSVLHFGATPASVRRQFVQAARKRGPMNRPTGPAEPMDRLAAGVPAPDGGVDAGATGSPFAGRSFSLPPVGSDHMPLPAAPSSQPLPPTMAREGFDDPDSMAANAPESMPSMGRSLENPFAPTAEVVGSGTNDSAARQASWAGDATSAADGSVTSHELPSPDSELAENKEWKLPDAPLPAGMRGNPHASGEAYGLVPPQRSQPVAGAQAPSRPVGPIQKQQVLARLQMARQALEAGNLDLAERLAREAGAAGMNESQFLPGEDRPSVLAWDVVRARQNMRGVQPAAANLPNDATQHVDQAANVPGNEAFPVRQAAGSEPAAPIDSDQRWAMLPEPLSLPSDTSAPVADSPAPLPQPLVQPMTQLPPRYSPPSTNEALDMLDAGEAAMRMHDRKSALELLGQAHLLRDQLDPADQARLQERLHMLASAPVDTQIPATTATRDVRQAAVPQVPRSNLAADRLVPGGSQFSPAASPATPPPYDSPVVLPDASTGNSEDVSAPDIRRITPYESDGSPFALEDPRGGATDPTVEQPNVLSPTTDSSLPASDSSMGPLAVPHSADGNRPETLETPPGATALPAMPPATSSPLIDSAAESERVLARQISAEVGKRQSEAQRLIEKEPLQAQKILQDAQKLVNESKVSGQYRRELLGRIQITLNKTERYIADHRAEIELDETNQATLDAVERDREVKAKVRQKIAEMVEQFNQLRDEQRYAEAEVVSRQLYELAPDDPVVQQIHSTAKFLRREYINRDLTDRLEDNRWNIWNEVEQSSISPVGDEFPLVFDAKRWPDITNKRKGARDRTHRRTERELEIERRLRTPVLLRYQDAPLSQVIDGLSALAGINIHLDARGLSQEGVHSDTAVTANLNKEISLKSALNLILEPLHLSYVIKDEVLKITSEQLRDGEISTEVYNVADLVIPIPNFVPNSNIGLQGLINDAHGAMGYGQNALSGGPSVLVSDPRRGRDAAPPNPDIVAQQLSPSTSGGFASPSAVPIGAGPGGMGGGANADFDSLIDLIVSTVSTETWAENGGGEAEIRPFPTNLSLVISQTQAVHEEIADLLEQLRRLQDLQITIEVRFITLNDRFFERIGVDFQMNIEDRTIGTADLIPGQVYEPGRQSATVGIQRPSSVSDFPNYTADLDIPFRQGSFSAAVPPIFGGFDPATAATFGFAILSDIEAFFLIEAAQGDSRTNVLNAPKVTLFNGQQAFVADATQRPFVIGVIPVVGEFVAAQQPVIVVLNEGTMMTIQAVVSDDRRYVRLTVVPFFTQIGRVEEFTFEGSSSTTSSSSISDDDDDGKKESESESQEESRSGVTLQLPSFSFVSVVTTVSVPDGGTVLLGGIKRLSEGRNEFGVPLLSKIPYVDRLFRNVGIARDTESLMMMVTPRIIIQEEEEERLGIATP